MSVTTWKAVRAQLSSHSVTSLDTVRQLTGRFRHQQRVAYALGCARDWLQGSQYEETPFAPQALCYLEFLGLHGGNKSNPGASTHRHPAFRTCGKGRRKASDGDTWTSAIWAAAHHSNVEHRFEPFLHLGGVSLISSDGNTTSVFKLVPLVFGGNGNNYRGDCLEAVENAIYHAFWMWVRDHGNDVPPPPYLDGIATALDEVSTLRNNQP